MPGKPYGDDYDDDDDDDDDNDDDAIDDDNDEEVISEWSLGDLWVLSERSLGVLRVISECASSVLWVYFECVLRDGSDGDGDGDYADDDDGDGDDDLKWKVLKDDYFLWVIFILMEILLLLVLSDLFVYGLYWLHLLLIDSGWKIWISFLS